MTLTFDHDAERKTRKPYSTFDGSVCGLLFSGCTDGTVCVWTVRQLGTTCNTPTLTTASKVRHLSEPPRPI